MKAQPYNEGDYVIGWFNNIVKLEKPIEFNGDVGFETDFFTGFTKQNLFMDSIQRKCTEEEIKQYKEKYG